MRTSTRTGSVAPSGMNSFSWMTRRLLGLHVGRDGADLVEENGSAVGHLEIALLGVDGAGEGALHMAEQRGFQQVGGQRAAVHGHEQALRARRIGVDGFGNQLLARAGFAGDQDGGAAAGHLPHQLEQAQHAAGSGTTSGSGNAQARSGGTSGDAPPRLYLCYCMYKCASNGIEAKNRQNRRKHGVDFEVAALVFDDPNHRSEQDRFVNGDERWQTIGLVNELLLVCHTWIEEDVVRIVSARKANRTERNRYYHGHRPL